VQPDLSLPGHPEAFAVGDLAALVDTNGVTVPGVAQGAMQMGAHAARIIAAEVVAKARGASASRPAFAYNDKGNMAAIGRSSAVAEIGKMHFSGWPAWFAWLSVHLIFLIGFTNKLSVFFSWTYSYFTYRRGARIITGISGENSAGSS
jgi:NADH:ubiquinone reductase (H+-translocating)